MKYCPNPQCRHRTATRSQAEYFDDVVACADCRAPLVGEPGLFVKASEVHEPVSPVGYQKLRDVTSDGQARLDLVTGAFCIVGAVALTVGTFVLALNGGTYFVVLGPLVFGISRLGRGWMHRAGK